jgi:hypothetical protein
MQIILRLCKISLVHWYKTLDDIDRWRRNALKEQLDRLRRNRNSSE